MGKCTPLKRLLGKGHKKYKENPIENNEIVIADVAFSNPNLKLIKKINFPKFTRFTKADVFRQHFDDQLFFYIKKE